jgi:hypothetical protein
MTQAQSAPIGVVVRRYAATTHAQALDQYESDLTAMVGAGYFPVGQSWGQEPSSTGFGQPGLGVLAVTFRYDPWAMAERRIDQGGG